MPELGHNRPDASSIGPILAQYWHFIVCYKGIYLCHIMDATQHPTRFTNVNDNKMNLTNIKAWFLMMKKIITTNFLLAINEANPSFLVTSVNKELKETRKYITSWKPEDLYTAVWFSQNTVNFPS